MRVYISGKIGEEVISDETRQKFAAAQKMLEDRLSDMSTVINPASEEFQETMEQAFKWREIPMNYQDILLYDLQWLRTCWKTGDTHLEELQSSTLHKLRERKSFFRTIARHRPISTGTMIPVRKATSITSGATIRPAKYGYQ